MPNKKLLYFVNVDTFFISHRLPLALEGIKKGYDVYLLTKNTGSFELLKGYGIKCIDINIRRGFSNPISELFLIVKLIFIYNSIQPNIIHQITLKPYLYGSFATKFIQKKNLVVINAITGLGYLFIGDRHKLFGRILRLALRIALKDRNRLFKYIFQNKADLKIFTDQIGIEIKQFRIIKGSGVNEKLFVRKKGYNVNGKIRFMFVARLLKDKGIDEFLSAAKSLENQLNNDCEFIVVGGIDLKNPASMTKSEIENYLVKDYISWWGHQSNIDEIYNDCDVACLPSYREGLPKSLVEAMSMQCAIITTNAPGCADCVEDGVNGVLIPIKDVEALINAIQYFVQNPSKIIEMGEESRKKMIEEMSLNQVLEETFNLYTVQS